MLFCFVTQDEHIFDFDLLDATKLIPEELVPIKKNGKMTLNRNPDNFFSELLKNTVSGTGKNLKMFLHKEV